MILSLSGPGVPVALVKDAVSLVALTGFRVQGAGCRVQGAGFRVQGSGFRVQGAGLRGQGAPDTRAVLFDRDVDQVGVEQAPAWTRGSTRVSAQGRR